MTHAASAAGPHQPSGEATGAIRNELRNPHDEPCSEVLEAVHSHLDSGPARRGTRTFRRGHLAST
jgi:hypothetical protein